jgi:two-component system chemotaxis sensor kinase CheA
LAQQQVVIKSLESNFKPVLGIAGATILGDGAVALIIDVRDLIRAADQRQRNMRVVRAA